MNLLVATLDSIITEGEISIIKSRIGSHTFTAILLDIPPKLHKGGQITLYFKENEVMLGSVNSKVSARNAFISTITEVEIGNLLCAVSVEFEGYVVTSIITKESYEELQLAPSKEVLWFVKSNEVSVQAINHPTNKDMK